MLDEASVKKKVEKDECIISLKLIFMGHFIDLILHYKKSGATTEYPATLYHHCFRWSAFFEERSITQ